MIAHGLAGLRGVLAGQGADNGTVLPKRRFGFARSMGGSSGVLMAVLFSSAGANSPAKMKTARSGRSSRASACSLKGHTDPGAEAVAIALESLARSLV